MVRSQSLTRFVLPSLGRLLGRMDAANRLFAQRQALARLDDARLADLGLSRAEAEAEAARAPWDAPRHWRG